MTIQLIFFLMIGLIIGLVLARANFCFVQLTRETTQGNLTPLVAGFAAIASGTIVFYATGRYGLHDPAPWAWPSAMTIVGAMMFGLGARLNGACTVGTIGRLSQGDLGGVVTLAGGFSAAWLAPKLIPASTAISRPEWVGDIEHIWVIVAIGLASLFAVIAVSMRRASLEMALGAIVIGALAALTNTVRGQTSFVGLTETLVADTQTLAMGVCVVAVFIIIALAAAIIGGRLKIQPMRLDNFLLEFFGGAMMATGAMAIPGTSDVVAFYGVPSGSPHAIVALAVIFTTVAVSFVVTESLFWRNQIAPKLVLLTRSDSRPPGRGPAAQ